MALNANSFVHAFGPAYFLSEALQPAKERGLNPIYFVPLFGLAYLREEAGAQEGT